MVDNGNVRFMHTVQQWEATLDHAFAEKNIIVVVFTVKGSDQCGQMAPFFVELSKKHSKLLFVKVDVDQLQEVAAEWDVQAMPTFIFIKDKVRVDNKIVGADKDKLEKKSAFYAAAST